MSKADEMFEELEYEKLTNCENWIICGFRSLSNYNRIWFTKEKTIGGKLCDDLTMQELQIINEKCKELGWV